MRNWRNRLLLILQKCSKNLQYKRKYLEHFYEGVDNMPKRRNEPKYRENPFLKDVVERTKTGYKRIASKDNTALIIMNRETGELQGAAGIWYKEEVERNQFIKLYADGVAAILGLKSPGKKVFRLVYNQLYGKDGINKTEIILNYDMLSDDEQKLLSRRTFISGVTELIKSKFIAESYVPTYYFINPNFIFNGNRIAIVKEYILKESPKNITD